MFANKPQIATLLLALGMGAVAVGLTNVQPAAGQDDADAKIENAMSAAPASVSADATILDYTMDDAGKFTVLREGTNGWSCFPDDGAEHGSGPMCLDATWLDWLYALFAGEDPPTTVAGVSYMLQGGSTASNTDPAATAPAEGEEWINDPPHVMLLLPEEIDQSAFSTDHASGLPYVMWAGTPYEHIMMPTAEHHE